jgi:IS605 OrfB family transposase
MPYHRTAVFKVHDPSGRKLRRVEKMQRRYSGVYSDILWSLKGCEDETLSDLASANANVAGNYFKWLIGGKPLEGAMWSGLVEDIQQAIDTYLDTPGANFPAPAGTSTRPVGELLDELLGPITREEEEELKAEIKRKSDTYARPINFARYRDNPIIRSEDGEKLWIAPHFQEREDGKAGALPPNGNSIRPGNWSYSTGSWHWRKQTHKETLPIECSRWHMHRFFREGTAKSSKVHVVGDEIYIYYSFAFEDPDGGYVDGNPVMGIDRGEAITAAYAVIDSEGTVIEKGSSASEKLRTQLKGIDQAITEAQAADDYSQVSGLWDRRRGLVQDALHRISNRIIETAAEYGAAIVFEDLENLGGSKRLKRRQFSRLTEYVRYKAEEKALWADVEVHPAGTSTTCPKCGHRDYDNRPSRDEFKCIGCGYEAHADLNAARMIAIRGLWQINGGKDGTGCQTLTEYTRSLSKNRGKRKEAPKPSSAG